MTIDYIIHITDIYIYIYQELHPLAALDFNLPLFASLTWKTWQTKFLGRSYYRKKNTDIKKYITVKLVHSSLGLEFNK